MKSLPKFNLSQRKILDTRRQFFVTSLLQFKQKKISTIFLVLTFLCSKNWPKKKQNRLQVAKIWKNLNNAGMKNWLDCPNNSIPKFSLTGSFHGNSSRTCIKILHPFGAPKLILTLSCRRKLFVAVLFVIT